MSAHHISFEGEIRRLAADLGRIASSEAVSRIQSAAQTMAELDPTGALWIRTGPDSLHVAADWLRAEIGRLPAPVAPEKPTGTQFTGRTAAAIAGAVAARTAHEAEQRAYAQRLATGPNPFKAGGNRTHQAFISKYLPEKAAQLKAQA